MNGTKSWLVAGGLSLALVPAAGAQPMIQRGSQELSVHVSPDLGLRVLF